MSARGTVVEFGPVPSISVAVVRRTVPQSMLSRVVPECCGLVWKALRDQQLKPGRNIAIYWNGEIRLEAGVELDVPFNEGDVLASATPAGLTAYATHYGPYDQLGRTHRMIVESCAAGDYRLVGPNWEIYGHWMEAWNDDPSRIRTDVFYQIAKD